MRDKVEDIVGKEIYFSDPAEQLEATKAITAWVRENGKDETKYTPAFAWQLFQYFFKMTDSASMESVVGKDSILKDLTVKDFMWLWFAIFGKDNLQDLDRMNEGFLAQTDLVKEYEVKGIYNIYDLIFDHWNLLGKLDYTFVQAIGEMQKV